MQSVAQSWLVLQITDSPFRLGLISTFMFGPMLIFSIPAGAVADRLPKRRVVVTSALIQGAMGLTLTALVASGAIRYWHVATIAVVWGLVNALDTPARQAFLVDLVGREDVGNAIALNSVAFNGARIVGPAVAGVLIGAFGLSSAFLLNAFAGLVGALALAAVGTSGTRVPRGDASFGQQILEGLRYAAGTPRVRRLLGVLFVVTITIFNFSVYIPLLTRDVLAAGPGTFGLLMAAIGIGAMTGAFALGAASRADLSSARRRGRCLVCRALRPLGGESRVAGGARAADRRPGLDRRGGRRQHRAADDGPGRPARTRDEHLHPDLRWRVPVRRVPGRCDRGDVGRSRCAGRRRRLRARGAGPHPGRQRPARDRGQRSFLMSSAHEPVNPLVPGAVGGARRR